jgi:hypothetical protein
LYLYERTQVLHGLLPVYPKDSKQKEHGCQRRSVTPTSSGCVTVDLGDNFTLAGLLMKTEVFDYNTSTASCMLLTPQIKYYTKTGFAIVTNRAYKVRRKMVHVVTHSQRKIELSYSFTNLRSGMYQVSTTKIKFVHKRDRQYDHSFILIVSVPQI